MADLTPFKYMDTLKAFAKAEVNQGRELMVFDWNKAARLIKEQKPKIASAGLSGDWDWTGGTIYEDGKMVNDSYTYLASTWATPELEMDDVAIDCYLMRSDTDGWDSGTKWPESAKEILTA